MPVVEEFQISMPIELHTDLHRLNRNDKKSLFDQSNFVDDLIEEQNEIADHILGMVARRDGEELDSNKSDAWQRGWADKQE